MKAKKTMKKGNKIIEIRCKGSKLYDFEKLQIIQGELKTLSKQNEEKLRQRIETYGFDAPFFVWRNKILDGTQRKKVIDSMLEEGWSLPQGKVPVCEIKAKNLNDAKQRLLGYVSQYGKVSRDGIDEFLSTIEIPDLGTIDIPSFDISELATSNSDDKEESPEKDELENYMSFVVTSEQRAEIEACLDGQEGENRTEQLLCLVRKQ